MTSSRHESICFFGSASPVSSASSAWRSRDQRARGALFFRSIACPHDASGDVPQPWPAKGRSVSRLILRPRGEVSVADAIVPYFYQPGEGELRWMGKTSTHFLATGEQTGGAFSLVDEQASSGESVPLHLHRDDMESFYVLEGEITLYLGDRQGVRAAAVVRAHTRWNRARFSNRVGTRPLPHSHDAAPWAVLPRDHAGFATGRVAATRIDRRVADSAGQPGVRDRVRRTMPD